MAPAHPRPRALWRYATGELRGNRRRAVREHARDCAVCRRELGRAIVSRRALRGGELADPAAVELEAWRAELFERLEETGAVQAPGRSSGFPRPASAWLGAVAAGLAAVGAAALVVVVTGVWRFDDELVSRGSVERGRLVLRPICVAATRGPAATVTDWGERPCPVGGFLKLVAGMEMPTPTPTTGGRSAAAWAVQRGARWSLYGGPGQAPLVLSAEAAPLPGSFLLGAERRGALRLILLATDEPISSADDPLWAAANALPPGRHLLAGGRAEAVVVELWVGDADSDGAVEVEKGATP